MSLRTSTIVAASVGAAVTGLLGMSSDKRLSVCRNAELPPILSLGMESGWVVGHYDPYG